MGLCIRTLYMHFVLHFVKCFSYFFRILDFSSILAYLSSWKHNPADIYLLKVSNRNTRTICKICSKLAIKTPERRQWRRSGVFIVNFEHISRLVLVFLLLISSWQNPIKTLVNIYNGIFLCRLLTSVSRFRS